MLLISKLLGILQHMGLSENTLLVFEGNSLSEEMLDGGIEGLLAGLVKLLGPGGTLVVPTCTPTEGYPKPTFDPVLSPSEMGPFSEYFRCQPNVKRSHSATHSVAALGINADALVSEHHYRRGDVLLLGVKRLLVMAVPGINYASRMRGGYWWTQIGKARHLWLIYKLFLPKYIRG